MNALKSPWFYGRIFIGLVFAYAGFTKLSQPVENFRGVIASYQMIPYAFAPLIAHVMPWIEFVFGVFMIIGYAPRISAAVLGLLCLGFLMLLGSTDAIFEGGKDCGCFGEGSLIHLTTQQVFLLDFINFLLALRLYTLKSHPLSLDALLKKASS